MNFKLRSLSAVVAAILVCSCATTTVQKSWKSPDYHAGPVKKIAVLAVDERGTVRQVFEGHTSGELNRRGDPAIQVRDYMTLAEIKQSKEAAAAKLREAGADSLLIIRLLDASAKPEKIMKQGPTSGAYATSNGEGWFEFYTFSFSPGMNVDLSSMSQLYYIEYTLFDLTTEKRIWSCVTQTKVNQNSDWLELIKPLTSIALTTMAQDGLIR